jgi:hypothetical protein
VDFYGKVEFKMKNSTDSLPIPIKKAKENFKKKALYKTELCISAQETGECPYGMKCQFAHSPSELRQLDRHPRYKTERCNTFWEKGTCPYGRRCCFIHAPNPDLSLTSVDLKNQPSQMEQKSSLGQALDALSAQMVDQSLSDYIPDEILDDSAMDFFHQSVQQSYNEVGLNALKKQRNFDKRPIRSFSATERLHNPPHSTNNPIGKELDPLFCSNSPLRESSFGGREYNSLGREKAYTHQSIDPLTSNMPRYSESCSFGMTILMKANELSSSYGVRNLSNSIGQRYEASSSFGRRLSASAFERELSFGGRNESFTEGAHSLDRRACNLDRSMNRIHSFDRSSSHPLKCESPIQLSAEPHSPLRSSSRNRRMISDMWKSESFDSNRNLEEIFGTSPYFKSRYSPATSPVPTFSSSLPVAYMVDSILSPPSSPASKGSNHKI